MSIPAIPEGLDPGVGGLTLDAEALYAELRRAAVALAPEGTRLVGITSGGAWMAERLQADWHRSGPPGRITSSMHRDDFSQRGMSGGLPTQLPFDVTGAHILLLDDVLYTGRTLRAVLNELFDYGRPASVRLAVLVDRGGRELPVQPDFAAVRVVLPPGCALDMARDAQGAFRFELKGD